jgi:hypothetical protein
MQITRTKEFACLLEQIFDYHHKAIIRDAPESSFDELGLQKPSSGDLDKIRLAFNNPGSIGLKYCDRVLNAIIDLKCILLTSPNGSNFITGDVPVVRINPFMTAYGVNYGQGLGLHGQCLIFSISPSQALFFYDKRCYSRPTVIMGSQIEVSKKDVEKINYAYGMSCLKSVYFRELDGLRKFRKIIQQKRILNANSGLKFEVAHGVHKSTNPGITYHLTLDFLSCAKSFKKRRIKFNQIRPEAEFIRNKYDQTIFSERTWSKENYIDFVCTGFLVSHPEYKNETL